MRVVVTGATGNVGTSVIDALSREPAIESILGIARRIPEMRPPKVRWLSLDVRNGDLVSAFRGAAAVVHLAWMIQPSHDLDELLTTNVGGTRRVLDAVIEASVPRLVYASSVGAYSRGPKDRRVDESWPTEGIETSEYSRHKAEVERMLDEFERVRRGVAVVRMRKALVFKREAASEIRRLFLGPFFPASLLRPAFVRVVPELERLRFQAVHSRDAGEAYRLAVTRSVRGAFNIAAEPVIDPERLARIFDARRISVPPALVRVGLKLSWKLHLQPTSPGWWDLALGSPLMETARAKTELGWQPTVDADQSLRELIDGLRGGDGMATPPLAAGNAGSLRSKEIASGVGSSAAP